MRTTKATGWVRSDFSASVEHQVTWVQGFDCRDGCKPDCPHERKNLNYGQDTDSLELSIRWTDVDGKEDVVGLTLHSHFREGKRVFFDSGFFDPEGRVVSVGTVAFHRSYPTTVDELLGREGPRPCGGMTNKLCFSDSTSIGVESIWTLAEDRRIAPFIANIQDHLHKIFEIEGYAVWDRIRNFSEPHRVAARALYAKLPQKCPACGGLGIVGKPYEHKA